MKYLKILGLAAIAAAGLMAFAGTASATVLTGTGCASAGCAAGTAISSEAETNKGREPVTLHPPFGDITCNKSVVSGKTSNAGSASETVKGSIEALSFEECNATVTVLAKGTLEIHTKEKEGQVVANDGTVTSDGSEVTVEFVGTHCIFKTTNTDIGTLTGSANTKSTATFDIEATIPRVGGRSGALCGSTAQWTGHYLITNPDELNVD